MKIEDAIDILDADPVNIGIEREGYSKGVSFGQWFEAVSLASIALDKMIPKEATTHGISGAGYWVIKCPDCETVMEGMRNEANFCCKCGQALKW
jgi:hypothetical protein